MSFDGENTITMTTIIYKSSIKIIYIHISSTFL